MLLYGYCIRIFGRAFEAYKERRCATFIFTGIFILRMVGKKKISIGVGKSDSGFVLIGRNYTLQFLVFFSQWHH
jgi:hypothetical protein